MFNPYRNRPRSFAFRHTFRPLTRLTSFPALLCGLGVLAVAVRADTTAEKLFKEGKFNQAQTAYAASVRNSPRELALRMAYARTLLRLDKWFEAIKEMRTAIGIAPKSADAHGLLSFALMRGGQPEESEKAAKKAFELDPKSYWALVGSARVALWNEKDADAEKLLNQATKSYPDQPEAFYYLLDAQSQKTPRAERKKALTAFVKLAPKGHPFDRALDSLSRSTGTSEPADEKKELQAEGKIDEGVLKAADIGRSKPVSFTVNFETGKYDEDSIILPVSINGSRFRLLFDTGAGHAITLNGPAVDRVNLPLLYRSVAHGVSGKEETAIRRADEVKIGSQIFRNARVETSAASLEAFDGLLGGAVFEDYVVSINYENNAMTLTRGKTAVAPPVREGYHIMTVPFHLIQGYIIFPLRLEDQTNTQWAMLDTGAGGVGLLSLRTARELAKKRNSETTHEVERNERRGVGTSSTKFTQVRFDFAVDLTMVHNGGTPYFMEMAPVEGASMMDNEVSRSSDFELIGLIGISYLSNAKRVTFDYPNHLLTMEFADNV